ncbi:MAG: DUF4145 domain-containing protein [Myxococcota bacterium]
MLDLASQFRKRLDDLIDSGGKLRFKDGGAFGGGADAIDPARFTEWLANCKTVVLALGAANHYAATFAAAPTSSLGLATKTRLALLRALRSDLDGGYLQGLRGLVRADVFADFIEQAEHLLAAGYFQPAAVVVGAVLEDGLRKLCTKHGIALPEVGKLDKMNADLVKAGAYDKLQQKLVTAWADLRNKAAHGEWEKFKPADVEDMLRGVRRFLAEHPA